MIYFSFKRTPTVPKQRNNETNKKPYTYKLTQLTVIVDWMTTFTKIWETQAKGVKGKIS